MAASSIPPISVLTRSTHAWPSSPSDGRGDSWRLRVEFKEGTSASPATDYPRFVDGERRAPPEDVGGKPGFEYVRKAMAKPRHPELAWMIQWDGGVFDPADISPDEVNTRMAKRAKRRAQGKLANASSPSRGA